jgi:putative protein-disulfide isomerase
MLLPRAGQHQVKEQVSEKQPQKQNRNKGADQVYIKYYTDPLCCWSWAFEQSWRKFIHAYGTSIQHEYVMCGMIPDWNTYNDPLNSISRPLQMGPLWMHASEITQVKMRYSIWHEDPPSSSYPSCIAVKCAALQSSAAGEQFLFNVRKALMEDGMNISKIEVLIDIARKTQQQIPELFDVEKFIQAWQDGKGKEAFRADLQKAKFHSIGRYPSITFQNKKGKGLIIVGYRPYEILLQAFKKVQE